MADTPVQEVIVHVPTLRGRPLFPSVVDNTQRSDFVKCPTKWIRAFGFNLAPVQPSVHLHAGGAFARGLEVARKSFWENKNSVGEAKRDGLQALIQFYGPFVAPPTRQGDKSLENVIKAFDSYLQTYPLDTDIIKPFKTASGNYMIEFNFTMPTEIPNPSCPHCEHPNTYAATMKGICESCGGTLQVILYGGRSDMIGTAFDTVFVTDEKTTNQLGEQWANNWVLDSQFTGYVAAARFHKFTVAGALVRGVGLLKTKISHAEARVYRNQYEIDRWWGQLHRDLRRMVLQYCEWDFDLALDKSACNAYGGCTFVPLCNSTEPEKWMNLYRIRKWDPLAKDFGEKLLENPALKQEPGDDLVIDLKELM